MKNIIKYLARLLLLAPFVLGPLTAHASAPGCVYVATTIVVFPTLADAPLFANECMMDSNYRTEFVFQPDGNLVVYDTASGRPLWSPRTDGKGANLAVFQHDGNLVVYRNDTPLWSSITWGHSPAELVVQDDGNVVIYDLSSGKPLWATMTNRF